MTSADSMATSVPAPRAIPTSAWTSAGASFTPSPTMATTFPWPWSSFTRRLVLREHLGKELVQAKLPGHPPSHVLRITGDHGHPDPHLLEPGHRLAGLLPDHVGQGEGGRDCAVLDQAHHGLAFG